MAERAAVRLAAALVAGVLAGGCAGAASGAPDKLTTTTRSSGAPATTNTTPTIDVGPISADFQQAKFSTYYSVTPTDAGNRPLSYTWSVTIPADPNCASGFKGNAPNQNEATWFHEDLAQGGPCDHSGNIYGPKGHPGTVTVTVGDGVWSCTVSIVGTVSQVGAPNQTCKPA